MEVNDHTLSVLRELLINGLSADNTTRRSAESYIKSQEAQRGFPVLVLTLIQRLIVPSPSSQDLIVRQSASVLFKNVVKNHWMNEESSTLISPEDKEVIKTHVVELMTTAPTDVQKQLSEAVSLISNHDFPDRWPNLLPQLVQKLNTDDLLVKKGVMLTVNSIMKRFRYVFKSDELYAVLVECLKTFQEPLLQQFVQNNALIAHSSTNLQQLLVLFETQRLIARVFFSLNWQDIPEYFEDHIGEWMQEFAKYLSYTNPMLVDADEEHEAGPIEVLQTAVIENLNLYATRYEEIFEPYLQKFTELIWSLLLSVSSMPKHDYLAVGAIKFLTSVASKQMNTKLFTENILKDIVEHIVIKNLFLTENDESLFEDNVYDYIQKDFEGSDNDTRRRSAMELIRALMKFFPSEITAMSMAYLSHLFGAYAANRKDYKSKDAALHLVLSISLKSSSTQSSALEVNPQIDVRSILQEHVIPELLMATPVHDIVRADAVKFLCIFRNHLPLEMLKTLLPLLTALTAHSNIVVQTYAAITLERFLSLRDKDPATGVWVTRLQKEDLMPVFESLVTNIFKILNSSNSEQANNEYVMKTLMRCLVVIGPDVVSILPFLIPQLVQLLERVCKNPINPHYNHFLFECLATVVNKSTVNNPNAPQLCGQFEAALFPPFQMILAQDVIEFIPYCFQIFAQLLFANVHQPLSDPYKALFSPLLAPVLWEKKGNVPALTDLLRAYLARGINEIVAMQQLTGVLGVFQKLLASKATEVHAFALLNAILVHCPGPVLAPFVSTLFSLLLQRMMESVKESKTTRYVRLFLQSMCIFSVHHGGALLHQTLDSLTPNLVTMIVRNIWSQNVGALALQCPTGVENKLTLIGGTVFMAESPAFQDVELWSVVMCAMIALLAPSPAVAPALHLPGDEEPVLHEPTSGGDGVYSKLAFANMPGLLDVRPEVASGGAFFLQGLAAFIKTRPQHKAVIQSGLDQTTVKALQAACQQHGVSLA